MTQCTPCNLCIRRAAWSQSPRCALAARYPCCRRRSLRHTPLLSVMMMKMMINVRPVCNRNRPGNCVCFRSRRRLHPADHCARCIADIARTPVEPPTCAPGPTAPYATYCRLWPLRNRRQLHACFPKSVLLPYLGCLASAAILPVHCLYTGGNPESTVHPLNAV